ncbi:MAG: helix-turn-helix domain-containing protein, partial [Actinobacteria bacterium]|nr:helix-turn-helix domain-containing protein [Actinomycetota bacterium]
MTLQAPLPVLPARAVQIGDVAGLVQDETGGQVYVRGEVIFAWGPGDEACRRLAAVQLVELKIAATRPVAAAFGVTDQTIWRWRTAYAGQGVGSLVGEKKGPKRASKLTQDVVTDIIAGKAAGGSNRAVAAAAGVSEGSVRTVMAAHQAAKGSDEVDGPAREQAETVGQEAAGQVGTDELDPADTVGPVEPEPAQEQDGVLPVLADPVPRWGERALARAGLLDHAVPVFTPAARVPLAGLLLGLPGLERTGLLDCATQVYGALPDGFYGLDTVLTEAVFRTLAGAPRAEGATRIDPAALGRVLGMDRAPEVKTIRRKLGQLAAAGKAAELIAGMAATHLDRLTDTQGTGQDGVVLYVDGHVRAYTGTKKIAKTHLSRLRFPAPATVETWVCDAAGDPVLVVMAQPGASLAMELRALLPQLRQAVGDDRRVLVGFDRGGWSPALFAHMHQNGFDVLTWRKHPAPDLDVAAFSPVVFTDSHGLEHHWVLADTHVELPLTGGEGATFGMRQVTRRDPRSGKQAHVLTTRTDLAAGEVMYRMGSRWRQENYFRYGRLHLDLDSHDTYTATSDDPSRSVPNPDKRTAHQDVAAA